MKNIRMGTQMIWVLKNKNLVSFQRKYHHEKNTEEPLLRKCHILFSDSNFEFSFCILLVFQGTNFSNRESLLCGRIILVINLMNIF